MDSHRLHVTVGPNTFDAEGEKEVVQAQFDAWRELIAMALSSPSRAIMVPATETVRTGDQAPQARLIENANTQNLLKIMRHEDRVVSLTVRPDNADEAVLLLLLGQKVFRDNDSVTGAEVVQGLEISGIRVGRVDRVLDRLAEGGEVIVIGQRRGRRYRLTNTGATRATDLANAHMANVA